MKKQLNNTRGETIVEIMVSFLLLMLFTALFVAALRYAQAMMARSAELRETAFQLTGQVYPPGGEMQQGTPIPGAGEDYTFRAPAAGSFTVRAVARYRLEAEETDSSGERHTYTFHTYGKGAAP